jgi:hypothetical protein
MKFCGAATKYGQTWQVPHLIFKVFWLTRFCPDKPHKTKDFVNRVAKYQYERKG